MPGGRCATRGQPGSATSFPPGGGSAISDGGFPLNNSNPVVTARRGNFLWFSLQKLGCNGQIRTFVQYNGGWRRDHLLITHDAAEGGDAVAPGDLLDLSVGSTCVANGELKETHAGNASRAGGHLNFDPEPLFSQLRRNLLDQPATNH